MSKNVTHGMDVAAADTAVKAITSIVRDLESKLGKLNGDLTSLPWEGDDERQFKSLWEQVRKGIDSAVKNLNQMGEALNNQRKQQIAVSGR